MALTCDIVAAHVSSNVVAVGEVHDLIDEVYRALAGLGSAPVAPEKREPAVSIRSSIRNDHIICLEDGKKMKLLKFHLMSGHGLTPAEYRARWGLEPDYPMVAPDYATRRRALATQFARGRKSGQARSRRKDAGT